MQTLESMTRVWLLLGVLALANGQIVYPGQYNMMTTNFGRASALSANYQAVSSSQPVQINQQFNPGSAVESKPVEGQFYPTTTHLPLYSSANTVLTASPQSTSEAWRNHVNYCYLHIPSWSLNLSCILLNSLYLTFPWVTIWFKVF